MGLPVPEVLHYRHLIAGSEVVAELLCSCTPEVYLKWNWSPASGESQLICSSQKLFYLCIFGEIYL